MTHRYKTLIVSLISVWSVMSLSGCATLLSNRMPRGSITMKQAYHNALNGSDNTRGGATLNHVRSKVNVLRKHAFHDKNSYKNNTHTEKNALNALFPRLPNPSIVMYVYPHEAGTGDNRVPVPGYSTVFPLYEHVHYAMPGDRR